MSKHQTLVDTITTRIRDGVYQPGDQIPTYRELAQEFGASAATVRTAILTLKAAGLLEGRVPEGVFVPTNAKARMRIRDMVAKARPLSQEEIEHLRRLLAAPQHQGA